MPPFWGSAECPRAPRSNDRLASWIATLLAVAAPAGIANQESLQPRKEVGEIDEVLVLHRVDDLGHLRVVAVPRIVLVSTQRLEQVIPNPIDQNSCAH